MSIDPVLVKSTFASVESHGTEVTAWFYRHLFEHHPDVRPLFAEHMDEQQDRLFAALGTLVSQLEDTDALVGSLTALGRRHAAYGALPEHFPAVGASLIATLRHFAGDTWSPEAEAAWAAVYGIVADTMGRALAEAGTSGADV
ncbi:globin domain-containing protein [Kitasatospora sp. NPDC051914]|uniref:globin domain-containing protein n=1 Tax=Kitasatospora sp. NPDC051914 TaxID=3154945 RepID=UPI00342E3D40